MLLDELTTDTWRWRYQVCTEAFANRTTQRYRIRNNFDALERYSNQRNHLPSEHLVWFPQALPNRSYTLFVEGLNHHARFQCVDALPGPKGCVHTNRFFLPAKFLEISAVYKVIKHTSIRANSRN